ncbi:hypothetical protein NCS52_00166500 [Fusarium sp. LHS14.1]|nr:hypothetical protein NCS52_00166500 [Fusarium sp. LHS14.1]
MDAEAPQIPHVPLTFPLLPTEIRVQIITEAAQHSPRGHLAAVSKEWQLFIEEKTFESLVFDDIDQLKFLDWYVTGKREHLVKRICLNVELSCVWTFSCFLTALFAHLGRWTKGDLTLEINAYSPSDSDHFFKGYYVGDPDEDEAFGDARTFDDARHGFSPDGQEVPLARDTREVYDMMDLSDLSLHQVRVIKRLLIRRQCRRQFTTDLLFRLLASLPALEHIHYEPWRMSDEKFQDGQWYPDFGILISGHLPRNLKTLILFEDFNELFFPDVPPSTRVPNAQTSRSLLHASLNLEHLSASFMVDAQDFFDASQTCCQDATWERLEFLALTSRLVDPADKDFGLTNLLYAAGIFALRAPRLRTMILWYGNKNKAYAFIYKRDDTSITWHGTRDFHMNQQRITQI